MKYQIISRILTNPNQELAIGIYQWYFMMNKHNLMFIYFENVNIVIKFDKQITSI